MADDSKHRHLTAFRPAVARRRGERWIAAPRHDLVRLPEPRQIARRRVSPRRSDRARRRCRQRKVGARAGLRDPVVAARNARRVPHRRDGRRARARAHHRDRGAHHGRRSPPGNARRSHAGGGRWRRAAAARASADRRATLGRRRHRRSRGPIEELPAGRPGRRGFDCRADAGRSRHTTKSWRRVRRLKELALDRDVAMLATAPLPRLVRAPRPSPDARRFRRARRGETASPTSCSDCFARTCTSRRATSRAPPSC